MYDDVLLPTDGSAGTMEAIEHALTIASDEDATLHGLYVLDRRLYTAASAEAQDDVVQTLEEEAEHALEDVCVRAADAGLTVETARTEGIPHRAIVEYATEADVDLIVMGTHGRTGPDRIANLGSTTERVVKNGDRPVLVVDIE